MNFDKKWIAIFILICLSACSIKLLPSKDEWYTKHYIVMHEFEWEVYKTLSSEGKKQFQQLFWEVRDPEAQVTFANRLDYVTENFKRESYHRPWNTDRGRIYLLNGKPAGIRYVENTEMGSVTVVSSITAAQHARMSDRSKEDIGARMAELWDYPYKSYIITYQFNFVQPNAWKLNVNLSESQFLGELERYSREATYRIIDVEKYREQLDELKKIK